MASPGSTAAPRELDSLLATFVAGLRGETLRTQLAAKHPERTREEIEDAIQTACKCFIDETDGITAPGQVYKWVRTVAHRSLNRERDRLDRQVPDGLTDDGLEAISAEAPSPEQLLCSREDETDLAGLTATVVSTLPQRQRNVLALWGDGHKRPEIAARLGITDRAVKRDLLDILDQARAALAQLAGRGCDRGGFLVLRLVCGLANPVQMAQAQLHLSRCPRCQQFHERLNLWREKVGAVLPAPVSEQIEPGLIERTLHKSLDTLGSLRQHVVEGGAQLKQQAATTYYRAADPTPLAGARPGAVAAVVAGCLAVGTGTYTCVERGINPLTAIPGIERQTPEHRAATPTPKTAATEAATTETPATEAPPAPSPAPVAVEPVMTPEPSPPPPATEPVEPAPPQPPPEQSFEPSSPAYAPASPSSSAATPAPVADGGGSSEFEP